MAGEARRGFRFAIDRGGTFTDIFAQTPEGETVVMKLLSNDPDNYPDAPREGIRRILEKHTGKKLDKKKPVPTEDIEWIRMGTTVATNALLERTGSRTLFVVTKGLRDLLSIGNQSRPKIFDLTLKRAQALNEKVVEIDERVILLPPAHLDLHKDLDTPPPFYSPTNKVVKSTTGDWIEILKEPNEEEIREDLKRIREEEGIESVSICLLHSYAFPLHEEKVGEICKSLGFHQISLSSHLMPMIKILPRAQTATLDAYLTPLIRDYLESFCGGFDDPEMKKVDVSFMMSDGGLCQMDKFCGFKSILSGPAGGVVGYAKSAYDSVHKTPLIGFDMGGTSTDVSRYDGRFSHVYDTETAGVVIQAPQLDINTVAAGGGSKLRFQNGLLTVGPDSVGAHPGPVCYRKGGSLSVTDANLFLGRLLPPFFPNIFGPTEDQPLDKDATAAAFRQLEAEVNLELKASGSSMTAEELALGFIRVANEAMSRPIRSITEAKGHSAGDHILVCFGGAGPQHACAIARNLMVRRVLLPRFSGILSAFGLGLADFVHEVQQPVSLEYRPDVFALVLDRVQDMKENIKSQMQARGLKVREESGEDGKKEGQIDWQIFLNMRYDGTNTSLMVDTLPVHQNDIGHYLDSFVARYKKEFGFLIEGRSVRIDDIRVRASVSSSTFVPSHIPPQAEEPVAICETPVIFEDEETGTPLTLTTKVFDLKLLGYGASIKGPAIILNDTSTYLIDPSSSASVLENGDVLVEVFPEGKAERPGEKEKKVDRVLLSVFAHRFMSIAEQMGRTLQRTAISTNIKERLDFSCAIFGPNGGLVANAPHLPVHLGSMQEAVKWQINHLGPLWTSDQVLMSNHPQAGGSHLPDITVISAVADEAKERPIFYVASRGHHSDIGGISPGSMPPFSRYLWEEGAAVKSLKIVENGLFQEERVREAMSSVPEEAKKEAALIGRIEGRGEVSAPIRCSGSRNLADNIADLKAQVAANQKGIRLLHDLVKQYGLETVQNYMYFVQENAEEAVRSMLVRLSLAHNLPEVGVLNSVDYMDDGSKIQLALTIDRKERKALFDFRGTSPQSLGNCNCPRAVCYSAIIYCLRCLVDQDIPLNQGCLLPVDVIIPDGSLLSPSEKAAVVGGNVLTSQRLTDVILSAFGACACSQGCMNNLTFGDSSLGYYETIAGGGGAGPTWEGESGVHSHMTNTRITDAEVLERRYPVLLRCFSLRKGSGGKGQHQGGEGVVRDIEFLRPLSVGILSERRSFPPPGAKGGLEALRGINLLLRRNHDDEDDEHHEKEVKYSSCDTLAVAENPLADCDEYEVVNLGPKNSFSVLRGDRIRICTPGGGGFGLPLP